ncbi:thioredoxin family protein [Clostridium niameyense]|uniref:Thioredoxin family protein n=1 Tax=Clostridium niameyense TaxID=1622073 RepID=A0A6M0R9H7_9CLOT|nr:thioredoxin family protein [Clostridium niameyense]NEZ46924.1 thioredoxin family protein [Clostridium niameyense]
MEELSYVIQQIKENNMLIIYFYSGEKCSVCSVLKDKIREIDKEYKNIKTIYINIDILPKISSYYSVFTVPTILLFIEGRETLREGRYTSILELRKKINRYYKLLNN